jgi:hydantoinase/carbamoylase family amidase
VFDAIDIGRIERRLDRLWEIGKTQRGGVSRLAYTEEETEAFEFILDELPPSFEVETDSLGNVFATAEPDAPESVYIGSHLDSVYNAGRLDGTLGVLMALEAIEAVLAHDEDPAVPPTLTIFRAEEAARFGQHTIGSRGALGILTVEDFSATDQNNVPLWQAIQQTGYRPDNLSSPSIDLDRVAAFLESHIEQGRVLDENPERVGLVTSIRAPVRYCVVVEGRADHSGATPMEHRQDALAAAARMIGAVEAIGTEGDGEGDVVATVGDIDVTDEDVDTICGRVTFPIDLRSNDLAFRDAVEEQLVAEIESIAESRSIRVELEELDRSEPVELDEQALDVLEAGAKGVDAAYRRLPSGGGHDAMNFQLNDVPTGMVFVPSVNGISHNPAEETDPEAVVEGTKLFAHTLRHYTP